MKRVAILQSNYIPWKGYFDIIAGVDEFIIYDEVQYTQHDWRNRNIIMTKNGPVWITIPVIHSGKFSQRICDAIVVDNHWVDKHWRGISNHYSKAKYFSKYKNRIYSVYERCRGEKHLSRINYLFIKEICDILEIKTKISFSSDYNLIKGKVERLIQLVKDASGDVYLSGPAAKDYIDETMFKESGITIEWMDYSGYPEYNQISKPGGFQHGVTVLDLIFNEGPNSREYMLR